MHSPSLDEMSDVGDAAREAGQGQAVAAAAAAAAPAASSSAAAPAVMRAFSPIDDLSDAGSAYALSPAPRVPTAEDLSQLLSSPGASPSRSYEEIVSSGSEAAAAEDLDDHDDDDDGASSVIATSEAGRSASASAARRDDQDDQSEAADDDELTILAVRRALHIPAHPQRRPPPRRIVHSPVNLLDEDEEAPAPKAEPAAAAAAAASSSSAAAAAAAAAASEEEADVCAICLSVPTDLCVPSACKHPFCYACLEQWTKIQMTSIYAAAEQARYNEAMGGWVAQGSSAAAKDKKSHPSCPMCKREYTALRRMVVIAAPASSSSSSAAAAPPALPTVDSPFESIAVSLIVPPPFQYHRPTLSFSNPAYAHNEHFRLAAEQALTYALRTGSGLATHVLEYALMNHPRVNALLLAFPPYRENLAAIKRDLVAQVISTRNAYNRRMGVQATQQAAYQRHRQQQLAMDHGGGMPEPVPMMNDSNASAYLLNRLGPQGSAALLSVAFGQESAAPVTNPILQLYRESRYQGGMTHQLGRMRLWSDLRIQHVPPQPDVIWALRQAGVGTGNRTPFGSAASQAAAAAAASSSSGAAAAASSSSAAAAASSAAPSTLAAWLNVELSSILATRHESLSPATHEHFLVSLVLSYLELLLSRLEIEERQQKMERENRAAAAEGQQRRKKQRMERAAAAAAGSQEASSSSSAAAAAAPSASRSMPQPLANSFVPSYRASSSSLHPLSDDAPTQLASIEAAGAPDAGEVQIVRERRRDQQPPAPRRSPSQAEIISLSDDEGDDVQVTASVAGADAEIVHSSSSSRRSPVESPAHLPGGHLHSLFALSAPLSSSVDFLFHKLEEFLRGLTGVFVHRTMLWILGAAYAAPGAGPAMGDPRRAPSAEEVRVRQQIESSMAEALQQARERWRISRGGSFGDVYAASSPSPSTSAAAAAASSPPSSSSAAAAAGASVAVAPSASAMSDTDDAVVPSVRPSASRDRSSIREQRAARLGQRSAPRSGSGSGSAERKEGAERSAAAAAGASSSSSRPRPAASGFMASVFGSASSTAAARPAAAAAAAASSSSSSAARPLRPPPSVASSAASSPERSPSSGASGAQPLPSDSPVPALSPLHFTGPDAEVLATAERRFTEEDNAFISGMRSSKRPRAHALEV